MTPKSPTPGSDWLASVAAENRERDDELERLRAENEGLRADLRGAAELNARMLSRPGFDPHICPKTPISPDEFRKTQMYWFRRYLCAEEYGNRMERRYARLSATSQRQGNETASLLINEVAQHSMSQRRTDRLRRHVEKLLEVNRRRKQERNELRARVAKLENYLIEFADYVDLHTSCDAWRYQDKAIRLYQTAWDIAKKRNELRARVAELEQGREDASPVPSAWPPTPMPIYDFRATSDEGAGE